MTDISKSVKIRGIFATLRTRYLENGDGVKNDRVDAGHLLEEHEPDQDHEGLQTRSRHQTLQFRFPALLVALGYGIFNFLEFLRDFRRLAPEPLKRVPGVLAIS